MKKTRATIKDVAKLAGVSWKTVSRVINRDAHVRPATVERVETAIRELDFWPNAAARSLAGTRSFLIGAFTDNPSPHYVTELYRGAARTCREMGYHLAIEELEWGRPEMVEEVSRGLRRIRFDGVFLSPPLTDAPELLALLEERNIPYVRLSPASDLRRSDSVLADEAEGIEALARHLWGLGHRRLGVVRGPASHGVAYRRHLTFLAEIGRLGGDREAVAIEDGDFTMESGKAAGSALLSRSERPTAIFASNDEMAAGVLAAAGERGLSVPGDVAVAGFDDSNLARGVWPPLTTVRQPIAESARLAVDLLIEPAQDGKRRELHCPVELVVRRSTTG